MSGALRRLKRRGELSPRAPHLERQFMWHALSVEQAASGRDREGLWPVRGPELPEDVVHVEVDRALADAEDHGRLPGALPRAQPLQDLPLAGREGDGGRSEEHTSELQARLHLVC